MAAASLLELRGLTRRYGTMTAVQPIDLAIRENDFFAILGPSGCGKTTLLRMIGGFVQPSDGYVLIGGRDVTRLPPDKRPTGMVFQNYGLFSHMTVRQNVAYGLRLRRRPRAEIGAEVERMLDLVHLSPYADRPAKDLSGGQKQRVALARALILKPKVLLLDEPLAALDLQLRKAMHQELLAIHEAIGGTFILVSHDQTEVMTLANRVAVMSGGRVAQEGSPTEIYDRPADPFVARFIGDANLLPARRTGGVILLGDGAPPIPSPGADAAVDVMLRPEALRLVAGHGSGLRAYIEQVVFQGSHVRVHCLAKQAGGAEMRVTATLGRDVLPAGSGQGAAVSITWAEGAPLVLPAGA
ncbi:ABC transporter ATP-binding protein [Salipiger abyssi]|uniref:ABC transporter ATP-binding protein n=1 Tax=Salipiger abyssi TaxID=1250539 RepID=UPI001A8EA5F5|nr:ABC transporter ATP-binding protein [Salipiger abyssi]MBN9887091.1 ABC transporter ATP-binding protein [Salipiger abyssi]